MVVAGHPHVLAHGYRSGYLYAMDESGIFFKAKEASLRTHISNNFTEELYTYNGTIDCGGGSFILTIPEERVPELVPLIKKAIDSQSFVKVEYEKRVYFWEYFWVGEKRHFIQTMEIIKK